MNRLRRRLRATSLLAGLVACFVSCGGTGPGGPSAAERFAPPRPLPAWLDRPPESCAVGSSGPTLDPRNSIRHARVSALVNLAEDELDVDVQSITGSGRRGTFEMTTQSLSGQVADARIVAIFAETMTGADRRGRIRQVHALACRPEADGSRIPTPDYPAWLNEPTRGRSGICAIGIAGPTWKPEDQAASALSDARVSLGFALGSRIEKRIFDDGRGVVKTARQVDPTAGAIARAASAEALEEQWLDEDGDGPLGLVGVLYGLACIEQ